MSACVIYNPAAGRGRMRRLIGRLGREAGGRYEFRPTTGPGDGAAQGTLGSRWRPGPIQRP